SDKTEEKNNDEHLNRIFSKSVAEEVLPQPVENIPPQKIIIEPAAEINEVIAKEELSLNDKLKTTATELGSKLQETPVKDLRKAIGINDRYLFITELFRGDEAMFDRSLKTINTFSNGAEAEYWIQRELKVKLGWTEDSEAVQQFDQLVRRRFS
ncbi:MAG TPA: hypothetical protein PL045_00865, partial [Chitinophagaceae bacterium]|nr:hypothetical protein [Chitinophagaceae bacterium]